LSPAWDGRHTDVKGKKAEQGATTRRALLDAACALFGERGYKPRFPGASHQRR
jgi:hypothetical protein